jgi:hypothetical protein
MTRKIKTINKISNKEYQISIVIEHIDINSGLKTHETQICKDVVCEICEAYENPDYTVDYEDIDGSSSIIYLKKKL